MLQAIVENLHQQTRSEAVDAPPREVAESNSVDPPPKYMKMAKMGIPPPAIIIKMKTDGCSQPEIHAVEVCAFDVGRVTTTLFNLEYPVCIESTAE